MSAVVGSYKYDAEQYMQTMPCRLCRTPTRMLGTQLCDRCYEMTKSEEVRRLARAAEQIIEATRFKVPQRTHWLVSTKLLKELRSAVEPFTEKKAEDDG